MSNFPGPIFGGFGFGGLGGYGNGQLAAVQLNESAIPAPEAKVAVLDPVERPWGGGYYGMSGRGSFPGFDAAPPFTMWLAWQMRRYSAITLAAAVVTGPILAGTRTVEIVDDSLTPEQLETRKAQVEADLFPTLDEAITGAMECLHFGNWLQEVEWGRNDGRTVPVRFRSFLPGEAVIYQNLYRDFTGFQIYGDFRDSRYAFLCVNEPHIDPIFGYARNENCREEWWRARQSELNADKLEKKASGIQMMIGVPMGANFTDKDGKVAMEEKVAQNITNAAIQGNTFAVPLCLFDKKSIEVNPELADVPAVTVKPFDWGDIGPSLLAHLKRLDRLDINILRAWHRPEREALEAQHGSKADSGNHGAIGTTDSELVAAMVLDQYSKQVANRYAVSNYGPKAIDTIRIKQAPLADPQQQFLQKVTETLAQDQQTGPDLIANIDQRKLLDRVEVPMVTEDEATAAKQAAQDRQDAQQAAQLKAATAQQPATNGRPTNRQTATQKGNGRVKIAASGDGGPIMDAIHNLVGHHVNRIAEDLEYESPIALAADDGSGEWRTINGAKVFIRNGIVEKGPTALKGQKADTSPTHLVGKTEKQVLSHGKSPAADRPGYHAIERDATGAYVGTRKANGEIEHVQAHADRLAKTKAMPGWSDVHLSEDENADSPVIGKDSKGKIQYVRSDAAVQRGKDEKFARNKLFHESLPAIRERLAADLSGKNSEEAAALTLVDKTGFRIGGDEDTGAKVQAYGATTLNDSHIKIDGDKVEFSFMGKKGVMQNHVLNDPELADMLRPRVKVGENLFKTNDGKTLNYLKEVSGQDFKNKDFRTEVASETARNTMKNMPAPSTISELKKAKMDVAKVVAKKLGNSPKEALESYIPPERFQQWEEGIK